MPVARREWTIERLMTKVAKLPGNGCWEWIAGRDGNGYGSFRTWRGADRAHRLSWRLHFGDIGDRDVLHRCDNPPCVRPDHLFLGYARDNVRDMVAKERVTSKLNWDLVAHIRNEYRAGARQVALASKYGVRQTQISRIVTERCWKLR